MRSLLSSEQLADIAFDLRSASTAKRYHWRARFQAEKCRLFTQEETLVKQRIWELWELLSESTIRSLEEYELAVLLAGFPKSEVPAKSMNHPWIASLKGRLDGLK